MQINVREIRCLSRTVDVFDLDWLRSEVDFGHGAVVTPRLSSGLLKSVDQLRPRLSQPRERWFVKQPTRVDPDGVERNCFEEGRATQVIPLSLLLTISPNLRFGQRALAERSRNGWRLLFVNQDDLQTETGPFRTLPTHFFPYESPPTFNEVRSVADSLWHRWQTAWVQRACLRYARACLAPRRDTAVVELAIGIEGLLGSHSRNKRRSIAGRAIGLLSTLSSSEREELYRDLGALYLLRNRVVHEGTLPAKLALAEGTVLDRVAIIRACRRHMATLIKAILASRELGNLEAPQFQSHVGRIGDSLTEEARRYEEKFFAACANG